MEPEELIVGWSREEVEGQEAGKMLVKFKELKCLEQGKVFVYVLRG